MRTATTLALAALGVLAAVQLCAAQSAAVSEVEKSSTVMKRTAPQRLAPPESAAPDVAREAKAPLQTAPRQTLQPSSAYPQPRAAAPVRTVPVQAVPQEQASAEPTEPVPPLEAHMPQEGNVPPVVVPQQGYAPAAQAPAPQAAAQYPNEAPRQSAFSSPEKLMEWVTHYREHPRLWSVPDAVHAMHEYGLFGDEEKEWFCIGFIAGILGTNPKDGPALVTRMFPMPAKEQEVIIRAIAYSGRPDWQSLLEKNASRMPLRRPLIDDFINGKRPVLMDLPLDVGGTPGIYALWGYYVATGQHQPVLRIMQALKWSKNKEEPGFSFKKIFTGWGSDPSAVEKISTGGTAKWTMASYAERDRALIEFYRGVYEQQPPEIAKPLKDVIQAAELFESDSIRKDQFGAIEDAQRQKMTAEAGMTKGMTAGSIAIATGCVAATALGQAQIAVPCVIGGALYTGAAKLAH